jgi:hypothetical protein
MVSGRVLVFFLHDGDGSCAVFELGSNRVDPAPVSAALHAINLLFFIFKVKLSFAVGISSTLGTPQWRVGSGPGFLRPPSICA